MTTSPIAAVTAARMMSAAAVPVSVMSATSKHWCLMHRCVIDHRTVTLLRSHMHGTAAGMSAVEATAVRATTVTRCHRNRR
jgi:hypothetical protein